MTLFLSCPGDMAEAKNTIHEAATNIGAKIARYGLLLQVWRNETHTLPASGEDAMQVVRRQMPKSFEIYVGVLGERLGTPTPRAPSGTIEEFQLALDLSRRTGHPHILFYFARPSNHGLTVKPATAVDQFRKEYPGLYFEFVDLNDLKSKFAGHLIDLLLQELHPASPLRGLRQRPWAVRLASLVDTEGLAARSQYLCCSSAAVTDCLSKLEDLFNLPEVLTPAESELLVASAYIHRLVTLRTLPRVPDEASRILKTDIPELLPAASLAAQAACDNYDLHGSDMVIDGHRCDLIASLIRLAYALSLERSWVAGTGEPPVAADQVGGMDAWVAYLTREMRTTRWGVIGIQLGLPKEQLIDAPRIAKAVGAHFESRWQSIRRTMTRYGLAIARQQTTWFVCPEMDCLPSAMVDLVVSIGDRAAARAIEMGHLGGSPSPSDVPQSESMLPLPGSTIARPWQLINSSHARHRLRIVKTDSSGRPLAKPTFTEAAPGCIALDPVHLDGASWYRWDLVRDDGDYQSKVRSGLVRTLHPRDRLLRELMSETKFQGDDYPLWMRLGLFSEIVESLWPKVLSGSASLTEASLVNRLLAEACEWCMEHAGDTTQADLYRNNCNLVYRLMLKGARR